MALTLYHAPGSRSARILWLLGELGAEFQLRTMALSEVFSSKEFRETAPLGRVPALVDGSGSVMIESLAIIEWLTETRDPEGRLWVRPGEAERADYLQWLHFAESIGMHIQNLNQQSNVIQPPEARSAITIKLEKRRLEKTLALVEARLSGRDYLMDRGFTAADIAMGWSVDAAFAYAPREPFPACAAWLARLLERPAAKGALGVDIFA